MHIAPTGRHGSFEIMVEPAPFHPRCESNRNKVWYSRGIAMADHGNVAMADRGGHRCQAPPAHCNGPEALLPRQGQPPNATAWLHIRTQPKTHVLSHGGRALRPLKGVAHEPCRGPRWPARGQLSEHGGPVPPKSTHIPPKKICT